MATLSIVIPVYNEKNTIRTLLRRVEDIRLLHGEIEIIVVDDGSSDGTRKILTEEFSNKHRVIMHDKNQGKGAAIRTGLAHASGDIFVIQDADLEYDPKDIEKLFAYMQEKKLDVLYGSRVLEKGTKEYSSLLFHIGGTLVTFWTNLLYGTTLTDEATCYKMFTRKAYQSFTLTCKGFEFCPEFTGKALRAGFSIAEIPISYHPRSASEGKKIKPRDGLIALWTLLKIRLWNK